MKITEDHDKLLSWDTKFGLCEALIRNSKFLNFTFRENGSSSDGICSNDIEYIKKLRDVINELLEEIEK